MTEGHAELGLVEGAAAPGEPGVDGTAQPKPSIRVRHLWHRFNRKEVLRDISFDVYPGEIFGFIGPNGSGKTTTIRVMTTLLEPMAGRVEVAGFDVSLEPNEVRRRIGYMPDHAGVYEHISVREYLEFFADAFHVPQASAVDTVVELCDLRDLEHLVVATLSKGLKQRLQLARVLLHDPDVLVLDEPASDLDPRARIEIRDLLLELRSLGKTIFLSSHNLSELGDVCTSIGILEQGRLLAAGPIHEIAERLDRGRAAQVRAAHAQQQGYAQPWQRPPPGLGYANGGYAPPHGYPQHAQHAHASPRLAEHRPAAPALPAAAPAFGPSGAMPQGWPSAPPAAPLEGPAPQATTAHSPAGAAPDAFTPSRSTQPMAALQAAPGTETTRAAASQPPLAAGRGSSRPPPATRQFATPAIASASPPDSAHAVAATDHEPAPESSAASTSRGGHGGPRSVRGAPRTKLRLLANPEIAAQILRGSMGLPDVQVRDDGVSLANDQGDAFIAQVVAHLVKNGVMVVGVEAEKHDLERIFLEVTRGGGLS